MARRIAILGVIAVCITGLGAAAWIVGGPITGTTHLNQTTVNMQWLYSSGMDQVPIDQRWSNHGHGHSQLYESPPGDAFVSDIWGGVHYGVDWSATYVDARTADQPTLWAHIYLRVSGDGPTALALGDVEVWFYMLGGPTGPVWVPASLDVVGDDLVGILLDNTFSPGEILASSLEVLVDPLTPPQNLTFTMWAEPYDGGG